jgi:uncharacterized membrane protein YeiH
LIGEIVFQAMNYIGIVAFAFSGVIKAMEKELDLLGALVLGFVTSLAGGILVDVLLGIYPPVNLVYLPYPLTAIASTFIAIVVRKQFDKITRPLLYFDAIGLGAFTASGAQLAFSHGLNFLGVAILASITATGGGVIRDVLVSEIPLVLKRDFYATPTIIGGFLFYALSSLGYEPVSLSSTFLFVLVLRLVAIRRSWRLPKVA